MNTTYLFPTRRDWWGERSIAVLGDSISFGVGCSDEIADNSYVGIVKKAVNAANGSKNYGFTSAYSTCWGVPRAQEIHTWPTMTDGPGVEGNPDGWLELDNGNALMSIGLTAVKAGATATYHLRDGYDYKYFCVYYHTGPDYGSFLVMNGDRVIPEDQKDEAFLYDCNNRVEETRRTGFFRVADFPDGITLCVVKDGAPVTVTGIGYYNDLSGKAITFNAYCRGGAMLSSLSDTVLDQAASSGTLILGLGYNDAFWGVNNGRTAADFTDRIEHLIAAVNRNGTHLIVNDYLWDNPLESRSEEQAAMFLHCRSELQRLAKETNGIYINQSAYHGDAIIREVNNGDGVHPTNAGHALMAKPILEALGLAE